MAQLSIFDKQRHRSDKDMTVSIGKGDTVYITFRHDSWKLFTQSDKIAVSVTNYTLTFGDPDRDRGVAFKLASNKADNPETIEHTRYIQICGKAWPALLEAARKMAGSYNFDEAPKIKVTDSEQIEKLREAMAKAGPMKLEPLEEEITELIAPKGFVIFTKSRYHDSVLVRVDDILQVEEFFGEDTKIITKAFPDIRVEQNFEEIVDLIRKSMTPQVEMNQNGLTFWK